jgi:hypothetical protein
MPKRPADESDDDANESPGPDSVPTLRPFERASDAATRVATKQEPSHERPRPRFGPFMSAFANHLANSQPALEAVTPDGMTCRALLSQMSKLFAQSDFDGALAVADGVADSHPAHDIVSYCARTCRTELDGNYRERLGRFDHAPKRVLDDDALLSVALDHREAFLLSHVDGQTSYDALVDVSPLPRFVTLSILERLLTLGVIE